MRAKWANTFPRWPPHRIEGRTYELSHLHPFRYPLLLPERPNHAAREVEIRVAFSAHTFTSSCLMGECPDYQYSTGPKDLRKFCPTRYEFSKVLPDVVRSLDGRKCFFTYRFRILDLLRCSRGPGARHSSAVHSERLRRRHQEIPLQPQKGKGPIQDAGEQGTGRTADETTTVKANPATWAGFVRRSSWLSHSWCGPFRAGRRGLGYSVTASTVVRAVDPRKSQDYQSRLRQRLELLNTVSRKEASYT
jgi:hypothetical protein